MASSDLKKNEFWVKKMTVRFHAMNSKKDGVVSKADFEILIERIIKIGKLSDAQAERSRMLLAKLLPLFGGETLKQTLEEFYDTAAKGSEGISICPASFVTHCLCFNRVGNYPFLLGDAFFDIVDTDGDGVISYNEWAVYFECIGVDVKDIRLCFDALDTNKDGVISRSEFVDALVTFIRSTDESHPSRFLYGPV